MARKANQDRGEVVLVLDGADYPLRPSFDALNAIEAETGKGLFELADRAVHRRLTIGELSQIAATLIREFGRSTGDELKQMVDTKRIAQLIVVADGGLAEVMGIISGVLAMAVTGGYDAKGEVKAAAKKPTVGDIAAA